MKLYRLFPEIGNFVYIKSDGIDRKTRKGLIKNQKTAIEIKFDFVIELNGREWPDLLSSGNGLFYVSKKLKNIIESHIDIEDVEFISTDLRKGNYFLLNAKTIDVIDYENSELELYESGAISGITKLVVIDKGIKAKAIFRLKEKYIHLFITDDLKDCLGLENLYGIKYMNAVNLSEFD